MKLASRSDMNAAAAREKKAIRRAEIERRAAQLNPPIGATTLAYMSSFQAAVEIAMPLNDSAWDQLKLRLIAQHADALKAENQFLAQDEIIQRTDAQNKLQDLERRAAKENREQHWDECKKLVHSKLQIYAENFFRDQYRSVVGRDACQQFAADLLQHVRDHFFRDLNLEDARMRDTGHPVPIVLPDQISSRKLTLDDMRWVNDNYVRPHTDRLQKELFLCSECFVTNGKSYTLDSLIQHYAVKHTEDFRMGSSTVYWKSNWPESPPFHPNPTAARASFQASQPVSAHSVQMNPLHIAPYQIPADGPRPGHFIPYYQQHPGPAPPPAVFPGPPPNPPQVPGYDNPFGKNQYQLGNGVPAPPNYYAPPLADTTPNVPPAFPQPNDPFQPPPWSSGPAPYHQTVQAPPASHEQTGRFRRPRSAASQISYNSSSTAPNNFPPRFPRPFASTRGAPSPVPALPTQPNMYELQLLEVVNSARELWELTSDILPLSDSMRAQVIIEHMALRFKEKYVNEPNLSLFKGALLHSKTSHLQQLQGLTCRGCIIKRQTLETRIGSDIPERSLLDLVAHFQSAHIEYVPSARSPLRRLDWRQNMIELPEKHDIRVLMHSPSVTQKQLELIAEALPRYFPSPLPNRDLDTYEQAAIGQDLTRMSGPFAGGQGLPHDPTDSNLAPRVARRHDEFGSQIGSVERQFTGPSSMEVDGPTIKSTPREARVAQEDEYDPHRPTFEQRYDTEPHFLPAPATYDRRDHDHSYARNQGRSDAREARDSRPNVPSLVDENYSGSENSHAQFQRRPEMLLEDESWRHRETRPREAANSKTSRRESLDATDRYIQNYDSSPRQDANSPLPESTPPYQRMARRPADYEIHRRQGSSGSRRMMPSGNSSPASLLEVADPRRSHRGEGRHSTRERLDPSYQHSDRPADHYHSADTSPGTHSQSGAPNSHLRSVKYADDRSPRVSTGRSSLHQQLLPEESAHDPWYSQATEPTHGSDSQYMRRSDISRRPIAPNDSYGGRDLEYRMGGYGDTSDNRDYRRPIRDHPPAGDYLLQEDPQTRTYNDDATTYHEPFYGRDGYLYERVPARSPDIRGPYGRNDTYERR